MAKRSSKTSKKLSNKTETIPKGSQLVNTKSIAGLESAELSFRFLGRAGNYGLQKAHEKARKTNSDFFKSLSDFIDDFYRTNDIETFIRTYGSSSGSKIKKRNNGYVKNLIEHFEKQYPEVKMFHNGQNELDSLIHLHLKRGGKGESVVFVLQYDNTLYLIGIDVLHDFSK